MKKTKPNGAAIYTETAEGPIPPIKYGKFLLYVKTFADKKADSHHSIHPIRKDGKLVYAVPGGGEFIP